MADAATRMLIAYDGSQGASIAVRAAAKLVPAAHAFVATVPADPSLRAGTAAGLADMAPGLPPEVVDEMSAVARRQAEATAAEGAEQARALGLDAEPLAVAASAPEWGAILDAAHHLPADVLVCGSRGRGAFARALLGSTSSSLLHHADLPLLVVPDGGGALDGPVVVAYDGSEGAGRAIAVAGRLLAGRAAVVVHGWEPLFSRELAARGLSAVPLDDVRDLAGGLRGTVEQQAVATTEAGVAAARAAGLDATGDSVEAAEGAWRAVAGAARSHGASVIAMGTRGLGAARSVLVGSVSSGLVHNAEVPILVAPAGPAG